MDLKDKLKDLFPDHVPNDTKSADAAEDGLWIPHDTVECHFQKRKGKPTTIIKGYTGNDQDFKQLAKELKKHLGIGGSTKNGEIILQGDYRDKIMQYLKDLGMEVKRVGG